jgi:hypothetical protein
MAELKGTQVAAIVVPFTDADKYATHDAEYGKGGFRSVSTIEDRDAIPVERKTEGMIVRVTANGLNYEWKNNAWVEWLPKGNIVIDTALNATSTNPVQNKVITTEVNTIENSIALLSEYIHNIPIITVDTVWNAKSDNPASSKAIESTISPIRTTANSAKSIADAAIPKSYIDDTMPENPVATRVPSTKLLGTVSAVANTAKSTADSAMTAANSAGSVANAAIPKSWIDSSINGTETSNNSVPGSKAIVDYVKTQRSAIDTSLNTVIGGLNTIESWKDTIGTKGAANGVAGLDSTGKVPSSQLPSYVDDVIDVVSFVTSNPTSGMTIGNVYYNSATKKLFTATSATAGVTSDPEAGKIYVSIANNKTYRWSGSIMTEISASLALGTTSSTAFRGDYGNTLYTNFGTGENLTGTQDARDYFAKLKRDFGSAGNASVIKTLHVNTYSNNIILQDDILYFNGEQNNGDGFEIPAATTTKAGVMTADMYKTLQEIEKAVFQLELSVVPSSDQTFEVGSDYTPTISLLVKRKGINITQSASISVVGNPSLSGTLSSDHQQWVPSKAVSVNQKLTITATYNGQSVSKVYNIYFKYKKNWGVSTSASLTSSQVIALAGSTWADSKAMDATTFDCTGGKYVYYVIPSSLGTPEFWVGGLKNTDVVTTSATVTNASGGSTTYSIMRLANIQTGVLSVQFK